ncbi:hypothetical protein [Magnetospirillum molischianum]|uniref:Uncharacterized protein n=1 Tax=Magnetospirillum molischianum DSM 120 TaxID=1150626 RepID=H8FUQ8_MAGML|nr:hypothetical protein [Magnetospirillum molischianum]CCG42096.1 conserved hypothetical protein [Magnetospirillum molischianum DSM 120]
MMARNNSLDSVEKARLLRGLAFRVHRKQPCPEALAEMLGEESRGGRHRIFSAALDLISEEGVLPALQAIDLIGDEAAAIMAAVLDANDHRLLSAALGRLADHIERTA